MNPDTDRQKDQLGSLPPGVRPISWDNMADLAVDERSGELYWKGKKVVVERPVTLGTVERVVAGLAALAAVGIFVIEFGRSMCWWGG
jgi:hypothetical protein